MTEPPADREAMSWLLDPPRAGEVRILVAVEDESKLSPELREALGHLANVLQEHEVQGYSSGRYFLPFPSADDEVRGHGVHEGAMNFAFRAIP